MSTWERDQKRKKERREAEKKQENSGWREKNERRKKIGGEMRNGGRETLLMSQITGQPENAAFNKSTKGLCN